MLPIEVKQMMQKKMSAGKQEKGLNARVKMIIDSK